MAKTISITSSLDFGSVVMLQSKTLPVTITNTGDETLTLNKLDSDNALFVPEMVSEKIPCQFPASATIYFNADGTIQDSNGAFVVVDGGVGRLGFTDGSRNLTVDILTEELEILEPDAGDSISTNANYTIEWSSAGISTVELDYSLNGSDWFEIASGVTASLGSYIWAVPNLETSGNIYIRVAGGTKSEQVLATLVDNRSITISTPTESASYEEGGASVSITGTTLGFATIDLDYSFDGSNWITITTGLSCAGNSFTHSWNTPTLFADDIITIRAIKSGFSDTVNINVYVDSYDIPNMDLSTKAWIGEATGAGTAITVYNETHDDDLGTATAEGAIV